MGEGLFSIEWDMFVAFGLLFLEDVECSEKSTVCCLVGASNLREIYLELVYLVTALVPSDTACLANSPGRRSLTAVWISLEVMVDLLL